MKNTITTPLVILCILTIISIGCKKDKELKLNNNANETDQKNIDFTDEENDYIKKLQRKGYLTIATRNRATIFEKDKFGQDKHGGLEYKIAKSFADFFGIKIKIEMVNSVQEYFARDGKIPDAIIEAGLTDGSIPSYTPDILKKSDVIVDGLSAQRWRLKLMSFVKTIPDKDVIVARKGIIVEKLEDLAKYRIAIVPLTAYGTTLKRVENHLGAKFTYVEVSDTPELARAVSSGDADITALAGFTSIIEMRKYNNLIVTIPLSTSEADWSHWAVKKEDTILAGILQKYINYAKNTGIYDNLWLDSLGISYTEFMTIIRVM